VACPGVLAEIDGSVVAEAPAEPASASLVEAPADGPSRERVAAEATGLPVSAPDLAPPEGPSAAEQAGALVTTSKMRVSEVDEESRLMQEEDRFAARRSAVKETLLLLEKDERLQVEQDAV